MTLIKGHAAKNRSWFAFFLKNPQKAMVYDRNVLQASAFAQNWYRFHLKQEQNMCFILTQIGASNCALTLISNIGTIMSTTRYGGRSMTSHEK